MCNYGLPESQIELHLVMVFRELSNMVVCVELIRYALKWQRDESWKQDVKQ